MDTFPDANAPEASEPPSWSGRYILDELLGQGGMGAVYRVFDPTLGRHIALKVMLPHIQASAQAIARFNTEAKLTAQLQHPGVVPVYEAGRLADGRLYFTMKEMRGTTLRHVIAAGRIRLRRQLDAFARVCQAIAYAHSRGVIHRDIKPDNIMIGEFGEVCVMDWGVARLLLDPSEERGIVGADARQTQLGALVGTPAYMAPELIEGHPPSPASDVYALGAVLFEILSGTPRYSGPSSEVIVRILNGDGDALPADAPIGLQLACEQAMALDAADRFADAGALAEAISDWLDGVRLREQAMVCVEAADAMRPKIEQAQAAAKALREQAAGILAGVRPYDPVSRKKPAWALEDAAEAHARQARQWSLTATQQLHAALNILPSLPEAHARLAAHYHGQHVAAERRNDAQESERLAQLLTTHDRRGRFSGYLTGDGAVTLITDPPGVRVALHRIEEIERRLTPVFDRMLGTTPLLEASLRRGRYLLLLSAPGYHDVRYPVTIGRQEHWHGAPPGASEAAPIWMPPKGSLSAHECYVPAGWFVAGGDEEALDALPLQRVWADGFVMEKFPVTIAAYLQFLNAQPAAERAALLPETRLGLPPIFQDGGEDGLRPSAPWTPDHPITFLTHRAIQRYLSWRRQSGKRWRLPEDWEWEKAGRGVDGRVYPWGSSYEATWTCTQGSHRGAPWIAPVTAYPGDCSVYSVRGMSGNVNERCRTPYRKSDSRSDPDAGLLVVRGGSYESSPLVCRLASRMAAKPTQAFNSVGFRLVYPLL